MIEYTIPSPQGLPLLAKRADFRVRIRRQLRDSEMGAKRQ